MTTFENAMRSSNDPIFIQNGASAKVASPRLERNDPVPGIGHGLDPTDDAPTSGEIGGAVHSGRDKALGTIAIRECGWATVGRSNSGCNYLWGDYNNLLD